MLTPRILKSSSLLPRPIRVPHGGWREYFKKMASDPCNFSIISCKDIQYVRQMCVKYIPGGYRTYQPPNQPGVYILIVNHNVRVK